MNTRGLCVDMQCIPPNTCPHTINVTKARRLKPTYTHLRLDTFYTQIWKSEPKCVANLQTTD